jgi:hypothetical protein
MVHSGVASDNCHAELLPEISAVQGKSRLLVFKANAAVCENYRCEADKLPCKSGSQGRQVRGIRSTHSVHG